MSEHLSTMTVEDRVNRDPLDNLIWSGLELPEGALPPLDLPGVRFLVPGEWTERARRAFGRVAQKFMTALQERVEVTPLEADQLLFVEELRGRFRVTPSDARYVKRFVAEFKTFHRTDELYRDLAQLSSQVRSVELAVKAAQDATRDVSDQLTSFFMLQVKTPRPTATAADRLAEIRKLIDSVEHTLNVTISGASAEMHTAANIGEVAIRDASPEDQVAARRNAFMARGWPSATELAQRMGSTSNNPAQFTSRLRKAKKLFGVWSTQDGGTYIHPDFQFEDGYVPSPRLPELLTALEDIPGFSDDPNDVQGGDPGRWRRLFWLYTPRAELSERNLTESRLMAEGKGPIEALTAAGASDDTPRAPADVWRGAPEAVIALARKDAKDDRTGI